MLAHPRDNNSWWDDLTQQRLKGWQPRSKRFLPGTCGSIFLVSGLYFLRISWLVEEYTFDYTDCVAYDDCIFTKEYGTGRFEIEIENDMQPPIWVYYQLEDFHQNIKGYVNSFDELQMRGDGNSFPAVKTSELGSCYPWTTTSSQVNYPCGLVARSVFNDTYALFVKEPFSTNWQPLGVDSAAEVIAWPADLERYQNMDPESTPYGAENQQFLNMWLNWVFPPVECRHVHIVDAYRPAHVAKREVLAYHADVGMKYVPDCRNYMNDIRAPTCNFEIDPDVPFMCAGEYEEVQVNDWGIESGHFIAWMRVAGLPNFRKLWGRIDRPLIGGSKVKVFFEDNFPNRKAFVLSTSGPLGGRNDFFGIGFMLIGIVCFAYWTRERWKDSVPASPARQLTADFHLSAGNNTDPDD